MDDPETIKKIDALFTQIENSINRMASNENLDDLVELLTTLVKAGTQVAEWGIDIGKFAKFSAEYYGDKAGQAHGAIEKLFNEHPTAGWLATNSLKFMNPTAAAIEGFKAIKNATFNISINGAQSPRAVAEEVVNATNQALDANSSMRTIENMRANTAL